ncbi:unnamed protein product [Callosobruchus maculatus]|uniref:Uncharacterized protein n=1 Tax=Callosobruchus maculatus TaxID=64391 RepID=A0A653D659_CALMS|nr:unnamed protein product [Callosobruchus maculatus]
MWVLPKIMEFFEQKTNPKRLRFTYNDDLTFLEEVVSENPFRDPSAWSVIQRNLEVLLKKPFTIKTLKNYLELLLDFFSKKDKSDQMRSGVEEPYFELDDLLREVSLISAKLKECQVSKKRKVDKDKHLSELGKMIRERYACTLINNNVEAKDCQQRLVHGHDYCAPSRQRKNGASGLRKSALNYLGEKNERDREIKMKEFELEERKLALEEKRAALREWQLVLEEARFEVEKSEGVQKIQLEMEEKRSTSHLLKSQKELIEMLLRENNKITKT